MPKVPKYINLDSKGCLCWETETYSPECCDPEDRYAEEMGGGRVEPEEEES